MNDESERTLGPDGKQGRRGPKRERGEASAVVLLREIREIGGAEAVLDASSVLVLEKSRRDGLPQTRITPLAATEFG